MRRRRPIESLHVALLVAVAAALRLPGLGELGLYGDEELTTMASQSLLADGFPHMPSGMAYWRAVPYTVSAALSLALAGSVEFAVRLPSAICGILAVPVLYRLASRLVGVLPAACAGWLLALSGWHVDMSREARMYAMFLLFFLLSLLLFDRVFLQGRKALLWALVPVALLTLMVHEFGVIIFVFWGLAWFADRQAVRRPGWLGLTAAALALFWYVFRHVSRLIPPASTDLPLLPETSGELLSRLAQLLHLQFFPRFSILGQMMRDDPWFLGLLWLAAVGAAWLTWRLVPPQQRRPVIVVGLALVTVLAGLGLFGLLGVAGLSLMLLRAGRAREWIRAHRGAVVLALTQCAVLFGLWFVYGLLAWRGGDDPSPAGWTQLVPVVKELVNYPALHVRVYLQSFPLMTLFAVAGTLLYLAVPVREEPGRRLVFVWLWLPLFGLGLTREWVALRYTLPVYPIFLMACSWTLVRVVETAGQTVARRAPAFAGTARRLVIPVLAILLVTWPTRDEHGLRAALSWSRLSYGESVSAAIHGFPLHPDHQGVAAFVATRLRPDDVVVAMDVQQVKHYLGSVDYWLMRAPEAAQFSYVDGTQRRDIYTSTPVIDNATALQRLVAERGQRRVWIITSGELTGSLRELIPPGVEPLLAGWREHVVFSGRDRSSHVYLFSEPG